MLYKTIMTIGESSFWWTSHFAHPLSHSEDRGCAMILEFLQGFLTALCATCSLFFVANLCRWNVVPLFKLLDLACEPTPLQEILTFVKKPSIFSQPSTPQCSISPSHSLSESCCWLNAFLQDIYFRMADGELIRTIKGTVIEPQINAKLAAIQSEYNKITGKIT